MPSAKKFPPSVQGNPRRSFLDVLPGDIASPEKANNEKVFNKGESSLAERLRYAREDNYEPLVYYDAYTPVTLASGKNHFVVNSPMSAEGSVNVGFSSPNPPTLLHNIHADYQKASNVKKRHRQTKDNREPGQPAPKTKNGQVVHALKRIVPGGDPETNAYFANSVANLISQGALRDTEARAMNAGTQTEYQIVEDMAGITSRLAATTLRARARDRSRRGSTKRTRR